MAFLQRVTRGAPVKRDWIAENTVREAVGGAHGLRECPFPTREWQAWIVPGYDTSGAAKKKGQPVMIDAAKALADDDVLPFATPIANLSSGFGVLTDDMEASSFGDAVIVGCAWTVLTGSGAAAGDFVVPAATGASWWVKADAGAKVLWLSENGVGLILLGGAGGGGGGNEYNGYFKAVLLPPVEGEPRQVKIIDGAYPDAAICGRTDIGNVNAATLNYSANASVYLVAQYANNAFSFSFSTTKPSNDALNTGWFEIAKMLTGDKIQQVWTGGTIYFGERYFV